MKVAKLPKENIKNNRVLGAIGEDFVKKVLSEYDLADAHDLERLDMAGRCLDEISEAEDQIRIDGRYQQNRYGGTVEHPAARVIRDTRLLFVKIIRELALDINVPDSRPPRQY